MAIQKYGITAKRHYSDIAQQRQSQPRHGTSAVVPGVPFLLSPLHHSSSANSTWCVWCALPPGLGGGGGDGGLTEVLLVVQRRSRVGGVVQVHCPALAGTAGARRVGVAVVPAAVAATAAIDTLPFTK